MTLPLLDRLWMVEHMARGAELPPGVGDNETFRDTVISKLCGEAHFEIKMLRDLNYRLMQAIKDLQSSK